MKSAYSWLLRSFIAGFGLLLLTQALILVLGIFPILNGYASNQTRYLENLARRILINPAGVSMDTPQHSGPFFVFSADKNLVYSNRGKGRSIPEADYRPIKYDNTVIGYYYAGEVRFLDSRANRLFLSSLGALAAVSMLISLGIAAAAAVRAARTIAGPVAVLREDITVLRELKPLKRRRFAVRELSEMSSSLQEVSEILAGEEEYKRQWMQNIAHDLRTPISGLRGQLEGMRDGVLDPTPERFSRNLAEVARLEELASSISELYTLENLKQISTEQIDAEAFAAELFAPFETIMKEKGIAVSQEIRTGNFTANRTLLLRAAGNIVANAVNYGGEGAAVSLRIDADSEATLIRISNDGPHIPEDQMEKIFQRFFRGEASRTTQGSGLGLNIAREVVLRHGGEIQAENILPRGAAFTIILPNTPENLLRP